MESAIVGLFSVWRTLYSAVGEPLKSNALFGPRDSVVVNYEPLTKDPCVFYVRKDRKYPLTLVNVFDGNGRKRWSIQRLSIRDTVWRVYEVPSLKEIATLNAGLFEQSMDFHFKQDLQHRSFVSEVSTGLNKYPTFYLADGAAYQWHPRSMYLERIVNPGGGIDETRERIGRARLMRRFRFEWEVLVDKTRIDMEVAIASAFITMITQWNLGHNTKTTGPTNITATKSLVPSNTYSSYGYPKTWLEGNKAEDPDNLLHHLRQLNEYLQQISDQRERAQGDDIADDDMPVENRVFLLLENPDGSREYIIPRTHLRDHLRGHLQDHLQGVSRPLNPRLTFSRASARRSLYIRPQ